MIRRRGGFHIRPQVDASIDPYKGDTHNYNFFLLLDWLSGLS